MIVLGMLSIRTVIDTDLASVTLPGSVFLDQINDEVEVPSDPRHKIARIMERFRRRAAQSYLDILRALCQNRCRIRRTMTHTILDWDVTQLEAEDMDVELRQFTEEEPIVPEGLQPIYSFPLSSWCYHYKLEQMEWLVQMGFELDVYAPDEMASMYYFLQNLAYRHYEHVQRIRGFVLRDYAELRSKPGIENIHLRDEEFQNALRYINLAQLQTTATHSLAQAISLLYTVLERYSLIPKTPHPYSTDEIRYEQRMKPFLSISIPELLPYEIFHASVTQPGEPTTDLIKLASLSVAAAKREYEALAKLKPNVARCEGKWNDEAWHENAKDQVRACIMASLTIATVEKAVQAAVKEGEEKLKLKVECLPAEKSYHDWWVVPKVMPA